ncbi:FtsH protease activity modulator HflK [candidate division LCP-89 bacterium B3_LCP]|uniref:Protein HflK n=1 Tax=candidate division LCP-89 bacterium B3_LCP TaxID=2012998 RepID=A0A532V346_UNCL8|nr:MAG: FtsH protease activity modulator HflK [candidate division LCP-89 bacterium B3_LCP]
MDQSFDEFLNSKFFKSLQRQFAGKGPGRLWIYAICGIAVLWLLTGIYIVKPGEMGVVRRFGKMRTTTGPGPHYHIPGPIERVDVVKIEEIRSMELGFRTIHPGPPARIKSYPLESLMITGDENLVNVRVVIQYRISSLPDFLFRVWDPEGSADRRTLMDAAETALRGVAGSMDIDDILTTGRAKVQEDTKTHLQSLMDIYRTGLLITAVKLQAVDPPDQVKASFKDVVSAKEDRERIINEAQAYKEDLLPKARGEAEQMLRAAEAYKETSILEAKGSAARFLSMLKEYRIAKDVTRRRLYFETMQEVLAKANKIVISKDVAGKSLPLLPLGDLGSSIPLAETRKGGQQ